VSVSAEPHEERVDPMVGGGLLTNRIRAGVDGYVAPPEHDDEPDDLSGASVVLGAAAQLEIEGGEISFLIPFRGPWPNEYWLRAFRQAHTAWPTHLVEPLIDDGRGLHLGPLPAAGLEEHVRAVKDRVAYANRVYSDEIEPELRRQREDALRREQEAERLQAEVESKLKLLLG
jgi:hypothetical protein